MAIAFGSSNGTSSGSSPFSMSLTVAADDTILCVQGTMDVSGVTVNGTAMTNVVNWHPTFGTLAGNCPWIKVWVMMNPPTGSVTIQATAPPGNVNSIIAGTWKAVDTYSYTPGDEAATVGGQEVTYTKYTTIGTNDWAVTFWGGTAFGRTVDADSGGTARYRDSQNQISIIDSAAPQTPGSYPITARISSSTSFFSVVSLVFYETVTTLTKSETITVNDSVAKTPSRSLAESFTLTDSLTRSVGKVLNEAVTVVDTFGSVIGNWYQLYYEEVIRVSDSMVTSFVFFITRVESLTITDAAVNFAKKVRGILRGKHTDTNIKTGVRRT